MSPNEPAAMEPSGRFEAILVRADGSVPHLGARERLQDAIQDADTTGASDDAQVVALRPRRVAAAREANGTWRYT